MNQKYIIGNWKCNMRKEDFFEWNKIFSSYSIPKNIEAIIAIPNLYLLEIDKVKNKNIKIAAQDIFSKDFGAYTGRLSIEHLIDNNIKNVIIGHSEQRLYDDNSNEKINEKINWLVEKNINVIFCIGENIDIYNSNKQEEFLKEQIISGIKNIDSKNENKIIIAYEPIWAIGTNKNADTSYIEKTIKFIKSILIELNLKISIIYGGSVNLNNIYEIINIKDNSGVLIGNASLKADNFINMIEKIKESSNE
jgi:triosephosphate isomerase